MRLRAVAIVVAILASLVITPPATAGAWDDSGVTFVGPGNDGVKILGLRYVERGGLDRVSIRYRGAFPDYRTGYARRLHYEGSGLPIPIRGSAGLWISITADGHDMAGNNLYTGPRLVRPRFGTLKALALAGDFEGQVTFAFALRHRALHRVFYRSPNRLIIDFRHR